VASQPAASSPPRRSTRASSTGSALLLVPAVLLVLTVLAALALDTAITLSAQRSLVVRAEAAAADGVAAGVDLDRLHRDGVLTWDADAVDRAVRGAAAAGDPADRPVQVRWSLVRGRLTVWLRRRVVQVFAPALTRGGRPVWVTARASADLPVR